ncbi:hypothetical protein GGX14DRAFT_464643 [Mycena pura]|uniref:Snurportin-1 n=1 Tax=Mycena pura TaxID=153505 RepID=A0AAD6Y4Y9_9AGAR|nr:hypothetical protein GGX14DRAFT_464643 [Mycena pura]
MHKNRKATYKIQHGLATNVFESQQLRRQKALEEQKRKRAQRVDAARQLDLFADLTLEQSEDEGDDAQGNGMGVVRMGLAPYASLLPHDAAPPASTHLDIDDGASAGVAPSFAPAKRKKRKQKSKRETPAASSKWADQCMYAELLEMSEDSPWSASNASADGLPEDLETAWVAVAPVPVGKRCLAVTDQSLGVPGVFPNTSLRSRKLGKPLMPRFPSTLPPLTTLDCILDNNWRENGILHILDVLKWKGQDIGDCETPFRFWWRDTRLEELPTSPPPPPDPAASNPNTYRFRYPTRFLAIPYHTDTSLSSLASRIVPLARAPRSIDVHVPVVPVSQNDLESMAIDQSNVLTTSTSLVTKTTQVGADGLLLYVAEASYETGTSPLSSWIPIANYDESTRSNGMTDSEPKDGPLDIFHRLVQKRLACTSTSEVNHFSNTSMDVES